jgi:mono/diheme cytochrome c family protein
MLLPAFIGSAVLVIAFTLLSIVARSPYTHSNLNVGFDPSYTRTEQMVVGPPVLFGAGELAVARAGDPVELGKQLFVVDGCAACHGLDGRGGFIAPSVVGTKAEKLRVKVLVGPQGMPAYAQGTLTDEDLSAMAAYLEAMGNQK